MTDAKWWQKLTWPLARWANKLEEVFSDTQRIPPSSTKLVKRYNNVWITASTFPSKKGFTFFCIDKMSTEGLFFWFAALVFFPLKHVLHSVYRYKKVWITESSFRQKHALHFVNRYNVGWKNWNTCWIAASTFPHKNMYCILYWDMHNAGWRKFFLTFSK